MSESQASKIDSHAIETMTCLKNSRFAVRLTKVMISSKVKMHRNDFRGQTK
jgi:hypothetical protein